jgi:hypothetical protein
MGELYKGATGKKSLRFTLDSRYSGHQKMADTIQSLLDYPVMILWSMGRRRNA